MLNRRWPRWQPGKRAQPCPSGPRCARQVVMRSMVRGGISAPGEAMAAMPHMSVQPDLPEDHLEALLPRMLAPGAAYPGLADALPLGLVGQIVTGLLHQLLRSGEEDDLFVRLEELSQFVKRLDHVQRDAQRRFEHAEAHLLDRRRPAGRQIGDGGEAKTDAAAAVHSYQVFIAEGRPATVGRDFVEQRPEALTARPPPDRSRGLSPRRHTLLPVGPPGARVNPCPDEFPEIAGAVAVFLPDKSDVEFQRQVIGPVHVGVRGFLAIDGVRADAPVIVQPELFRNQAIVVGRRNLLDQVELIRGVTIPVDGGDARSADLANHLRLDVGGVEVAEKEVYRLLRVRHFNLPQQFRAQPGPVLGDELTMAREGMIQMEVELGVVEVEDDDVVPKVHQGPIEIVLPHFGGGQVALMCGGGSGVENAHQPRSRSCNPRAILRAYAGMANSFWNRSRPAAENFCRRSGDADNCWRAVANASGLFSGTVRPVGPMTSGMEPLSEPTSGSPIAIPSASTPPNCSFHRGV